jgi:hypothetical protein
VKKLSVVLSILVMAGCAHETAPEPAATFDTPQPGGSPDTPLATSVNPGEWTIDQKTILKGTAYVIDKGEAKAPGVVIELRLVGKASFWSVDKRCAPTGDANRFECSVGDVASGDSAEIEYAFKATSDAWVVATARDATGAFSTDVGSVR